MAGADRPGGTGYRARSVPPRHFVCLHTGVDTAAYHAAALCAGKCGVGKFRILPVSERPAHHALFQRHAGDPAGRNGSEAGAAVRSPEAAEPPGFFFHERLLRMAVRRPGYAKGAAAAGLRPGADRHGYASRFPSGRLPGSRGALCPADHVSAYPGGCGRAGA